MKGCLRECLDIAMARTLSFKWGKTVKKIIEDNKENKLLSLRKNFCISRMIDNYSLPLPIDWFLCNGLSDDGADISLLSVSDCLEKAKIDNLYCLAEYKYRPYLINMHDLCKYNLILHLEEDNDEYLSKKRT